MKLSKLAIIAAIISTSLFSACTPNSLDENEEPSSIEKRRIKIPPRG
jgi:hypothetical protein